MQWILKYREKYHIRIVNISVGTTRREGHEQLIEAVEEAWDAGLIVVAAAGNQGPGQGSVTAPGLQPEDYYGRLLGYDSP